MERRSELPAVEYAERSDPGRDPEKQVNEDAYGHRATRFGHLCVVCDGMGGHAAGREAAELALATIFETFDRAADDTPPAFVLRSSVEEANRRIHAMGSGEGTLGRPGSTVVAVLLHSNGTEVAHVGDSRAYLVHEGQIVRLTKDHSIVQELVDRGLLSLQQAAHHPEANRITRALGMTPGVDAEVKPQPVRHVSSDAFVLCSDGLCDLVEDHEILAIVGGEPAAQAVGKLVDLANARGGHDNVTVVVLRARETAVASAAIAATVAETSAGEASGRIPATVQTLIQAPHLPGIAPEVSSRPLEPTPPPVPSTRSAPSPARTSASVIVGLALATAAAILLLGVLLTHFAERTGKRNASGRQEPLDLQQPEAGSE